MALSVQSVADDVNVECRQKFGTLTAGVGATLLDELFVSWCDRTQKDVLHTSIWNTLLRTSETFTSTVDGSPYVLTANNIRHILSVRDLANNRQLIPFHDLNFAAATSSPPERSGPPRDKRDQQEQTNSPFPQYYITEACVANDGTSTWAIHLLPDPKSATFAGTIRYYYTKTATSISSSSDAFTLPEDARDIMVAGVAALASKFLKRPADADYWTARYESLKKGF